VQTGDDHNNLTIDAIEDPIREPVDKRPPGVSMNHRIPGRMRRNITNGGLNSRQKFIAQPGTLPLIPKKGFADIRSRLRTNGD